MKLIAPFVFGLIVAVLVDDWPSRIGIILASWILVGVYIYD